MPEFVTKIWVDTDSGTWGGNVEALRVVEIPDELVHEFSESSDDARSSYALKKGKLIKEED